MKYTTRESIKLILADLDGTLLNSNQTIGDADNFMIQKLNEFGYQFTLATGKTHHVIEDYIRLFDIHIPVICNNGASIYDFDHHKDICVNSINTDESVSLLEFLVNVNASLTVFTNVAFWLSDKKLFESLNRPVQSGSFGFHAELLSNDYQLISDQKILRIVVRDINASSYAKITNFISDHTIDSECSDFQDGYTEIRKKNVNKGQALITLCQFLNIPISCTCTIGDGFDDLSMFKVSQLSIAMGNANEKIKEHADMITDNIKNCGFAKSIHMITHI